MLGPRRYARSAARLRRRPYLSGSSTYIVIECLYVGSEKKVLPYPTAAAVGGAVLQMDGGCVLVNTESHVHDHVEKEVV